MAEILAGGPADLAARPRASRSSLSVSALIGSPFKVRGISVFLCKCAGLFGAVEAQHTALGAAFDLGAGAAFALGIDLTRGAAAVACA